MAKKLTTAEFIKRANALHDNKYSYKKTKYLSAKLKLVVTCPKQGHGDFECTPSNHLHKTHPRGCPICGGSKPLTWESFKKKSEKKHPDIFEYPDQKIINAKTKVQLFCKAYGHEIWQTPDSNLSGNGCRKCADINSQKTKISEPAINKRLNSTQIKTKFRLAKHSYEGMNRKAQIICSKHGIQAKRLMTSILNSKYPCMECVQEETTRGYSTKEFLGVLKNHFGNKYKILPFNYVGRKTKIRLLCKTHGEFSLIASSIYRSPGCPNCAYAKSLDNRNKGLLASIERTRETRFKKWVDASTKFHKGKYNYSDAIYKDQKTPIQIRCPVHGNFWQTPEIHKSSGCIDCRNDDLKGRYTETYFKRYPEQKERPAILYYLKFSLHENYFFKVGITTTSIKKRFSMALARKMKISQLGLLNTSLYEAFKLENKIQKEHGDQYRKLVFLGIKEARDVRIGRTECFNQPLPKKTAARIFQEK